MTKYRANKDILELIQQAETLKEVAKDADTPKKNSITKSAYLIESLAKSHSRRNARYVFELPWNASESELRKERQFQAVKRGNEFYLPSSRKNVACLPNILLRSALFSASTDIKSLFKESISCQGDTSIIMTGTQLIGYDRRVLSAFLNYYNENKPLAFIEENEWVRVTFWQLSNDLKTKYGRNVHAAILKSLHRLNKAQLIIRFEQKDIPFTKLIDVMFDSDHQNEEESPSLLRGSDSISFRVLDTMANLYGRAKWSPVSHKALHDSLGLPAWLASYYSTHAKPFALKISDLLKYSGSTCELPEFRRRLKNALTKFQELETPEEYRVSELDMNKTHVTVHLVRWPKTTPPKMLGTL